MDWLSISEPFSSVEPFPSVDPFATAKLQAKNEESDDDHDGSGQSCEIAVFESRYNKNGERLPLQVATVRKPHSNKPIRGVAHHSALVLKKLFSKEGKFTDTELEIKSPHVITALRDVIKNYPGVEFGARRIVFQGPPKCIFHYRDELQEYVRNIHDAEAVQHLQYTLNYMYSILDNELMSYYFSVELDVEAPSLEYANLWMVFRPGDLIYSKIGETHRLYRLKSFNDGTLRVESVDFDGEDLGYTSELLSICSYNSLRRIRDLSAFPFRYHQDVKNVTTSLLARGRRYVSLAGVHYRAYDSLAQSFTRDYDSEYEEDVEDMHIQGRIMIDHRSYAKERCASSCIVRIIPKSSLGTGPELSDEELMLCSYRVPAFAFTTKTWGWFEVDKIREIEFDTSAFASLLLPPGQKDIIQSLVEIHMGKQSISNDFIKGKARGLIFMLYGVPGVGKTLTAESIAEHTRRPLYVVNCGDLGTNPADIEKNFRSKSQLAVAWNAVMLIDEADMFLEKRRARELQRNALVSVFLRILEYYEGILFLTTNRINACDAAIKSRVDLVIKYEALSPSTRRDLFFAFIRRSHTTYDLEVLDGRFLERLAAGEWNGREIKNVVRMAQALALTAKSRMGKHHLEVASDVMRRSNADLTQHEEERQDDSQSESEGQDGFENSTQRAKRRRLH